MPISTSYLKALPLNVASTLVHYQTLDRVLIKQVDDKDTLIKFVEVGPDPQFFFSILDVVQSKSSASKSELKVEIKPRHKDNPHPRVINVVVDTVTKVFDEWYKLIETYQQVIERLPDLDDETQRLVNDFDIEISEGYDKFFTYPEQEQANQLLEETIKAIDSHQSIDKQSHTQLQDVKRRLVEIKEKQGGITKGAFRTKFLETLAAIRSVSYPTFKNVVRIIFEESFKALINVGVDKLVGM